MKPEIDFSSATWKAIVERTEQRLDTMRLRNDGDLDPVATAKVRGRIQELKELLALQAPAHATDER